MAEYASKGVAGTGLGLGIAGTALGVLAGSNNGNGLLGGLFGGGNQGPVMNAIAEKDAEIAKLRAEKYSDNQDATLYQATRSENKNLRDELFAYINPIAQESASNRERVAVLEAQVKCENDKTILREQLLEAKMDNVRLELNNRIDKVADKCGCGIAQLNNAVACLSNTLSGITKTVIPKDVICPEVMTRYNSWVAPTTPTTATE